MVTVCCTGNYKYIYNIFVLFLNLTLFSFPSYEMQIEPSAQRQGLGKHMMLALEQCAKHWKMEKVVLTVLKNNDNAQAFFKAIGYTLDDSSPDVLEKADYEILSKSVNNLT